MEYVSKMKNVLVTGLATLILGSFGGCKTENNIPVGLRNQGGAVTSMASLAIDDYQKGKTSRIDEICNYKGEKYIFDDGEWVDTEESCPDLGSATGPSDINRVLENHPIKKGQLPKIKIYQRGKLVKQTKGNTMEEFEYNTKERTITRKVTDYDKDKVSKETCYFDQGFSVVKCGKETKGDDGQVVETYEHWESEPLVFGCWNSWLRELWNERKPGIEDLLQ
jgi:hypothetical protein